MKRKLLTLVLAGAMVCSLAACGGKKAQNTEATAEAETKAAAPAYSLMDKPQRLQEKIFTHLFEAAEIAKFDRLERLEYEESLKNYRDWYSVMKTAEKKGWEKGREEGRKAGREEGREEGRKEGQLKGREEGKLEIARKMKAMGMDHTLIAQATGMDRADIDNL